MPDELPEGLDGAIARAENELRFLRDEDYAPTAEKHMFITLITAARAAQGLAAELARVKAERETDAKDAARLRAMANEWGANMPTRQVPWKDRHKQQYAHMPIWDALCEAIGIGADGKGMRKAIDVALAASAQGKETP